MSPSRCACSALASLRPKPNAPNLVMVWVLMSALRSSPKRGMLSVKRTVPQPDITEVSPWAIRLVDARLLKRACFSQARDGDTNAYDREDRDKHLNRQHGADQPEGQQGPEGQLRL